MTAYSKLIITELDLDVKNVAILRCFDDFKQSGKMNYDVIEGINYYLFIILLIKFKYGIIYKSK